MLSPPPEADPWRTFAAAAPRLDPGATITAAVYARTVAAPSPSPVSPTISLPELPVLTVDRRALKGAEPPADGPKEDVPPPEGRLDVDFEVSGVLGEGGMGRVLLARQRSLRRDVAIKVVKGGQADVETVDTLLAEALITGAVEHPGVVPVHVLGRDAEGRPVLVMKRVEGVSWRELENDPDHPLWSAIAPDAGDRLDAHLEILLAVCSAAHCAHARGIVHRDIKLENVMVGPYGEVYLVDWGIAMRRVTPGEVDSGSRGLVGTPSYMAPEMVRADPAGIDGRTDVYLLGATLHAVLTGAPRHSGEELFEVLSSASASDPFTYGPEIPAELASICNRAMSASPEDRFPTALDFRMALASFRRHRGSIALGDQAAARLAEIPAEGDPRRLHGMLTECRFGFMAALRAWPENAAARAGFERCLVRMIEHEIRQRDVAGARALLVEIQDHAQQEALGARVDALEAQIRAAAAREAELLRLARDRDLSVGGGAQLAIVAILPVLATGFFAFVNLRGDPRVGGRELYTHPAFVLLAMLVGAARLRSRLDTVVSRTAMAMLLLFLASVIAHRFVMRALGASLPAIFAGDLVIGALISASIAVNLARRVAWVALFSLASALAITLQPDRALPIFSAASVGLLILLLAMWRRSVGGDGA